MGPGLGMPGLPAACVCTRPSWQGLALQGPPSPGGHPLWLRAYRVSQVFMPRGGARHQASTGRWGASMVLALAGGSDGTRHKHLEHTCIHVCVPHRHSMGTHVAYVGMHICTVRRGCADSWYAPLHAPLHPVAPLGAVGALLGGQASPTKLGTATSSMGTAQCCCLPQSGAGGWGVLKPGRGVTRQG